MNHPAELAIHQYLSDATDSKSCMSDETITQICDDIREALTKQFGSNQDRIKFKIRMSNLGRPTCQLWFEKNKPETALPKPNTFVMNMMLGDIVEAIFKGILKESGVSYTNSEKVSLPVNDDTVEGTYDLIINDAVDDIKSASDWSYKNKFTDCDTLKDKDSFGYVSQLVGYSVATKKKLGGWWVINKSNGEFKYVSADTVDIEEELNKIKSTHKTVTDNKFKRCYEAEDEYFRGKPTGNKILNRECFFCPYKFSCYDNLQELPAVKSQAKQPKKVFYVSLAEEYTVGR